MKMNEHVGLWERGQLGDTVARDGVCVSIGTFVLRIVKLRSNCRKRILENVCRNKSMNINEYQRILINIDAYL